MKNIISSSSEIVISLLFLFTTLTACTAHEESVDELPAKSTSEFIKSKNKSASAVKLLNPSIGFSDLYLHLGGCLNETIT